MILISVLIGIIALLLLALYLAIKFNNWLIKNILAFILLIFAIVGLSTCTRTVCLINYYHKSESDLTKIEQITQKRADLLPNYSLYTSKNNAKNHVVEQVRRDYYNQKSQYYNGTINKRVIYLKGANKDFNDLNQALNGSKDKDLNVCLKKDQKLQAQYLKASKKYSYNANYYNNLLTWPIERTIARYWVPTKHNLFLFEYVKNEKVHNPLILFLSGAQNE